MSRKSITTDETAFERCRDLKREGESWADFLERAADALEDDTGPELASSVLTEDHIADIAAEVSRRTADEVENRLKTR